MAQETAQQKTVRETTEKAVNAAFGKLGHPTDAFGTPLVEITAAAAELVPTVQYGNCTIGPVMVRRFVPDGNADELRAAIRETMHMCEKLVAEDRQTLLEQIRASA